MPTKLEFPARASVLKLPRISRKTALAGAVVGGVIMGGAVMSLPWEDEVVIGGLERDPAGDRQLEHLGPLATPQYSRSTVYFDSHSVRCEAWFYEPSAATRARFDLGKPPPIVIMAHGLGSQKDMGLHPYAEQFAASGLAVLVFDYRSFGGSDGWPRHEVNWRKHLEDWESAVEWVVAGGLGTGRVDAARLGLWGVSYSGGHVLATAAALGPGRVKAVVANEPYLQAQAAVAKLLRERGAVSIARAMAAAVNDKVRGLLGLPPAYIKLVGRTGELALLQLNDEEWAQIQRPAPQRQGGWKNLATARMLLGAAAYSPLSACSAVKCPVLVVAGSRDEICPLELAAAAVERIGPQATLLERPHGHLELHRRGAEPEFIQPVIEFLQKQLGGVVVDSAPAGPMGHTTSVSQFG
ncbi:hypothetical protein HYH02_012700 [Chlamydomonas schloesseri]|uniref:Xaa-Pro dipeptidyl-peptidase-like domain-containing protein n=1 Tax=Chlamydomonas schloesseri TaxID=2026947 RepID=A0A835SWN7_9CHLO|nr:hypothetical protein HYH02_012700 [Chlamydomonas schloesseri]|eukprot:KAG2433156.1 hypothetical protein HYH02_012700 [Chlamydomonas schloesseri]